MHLIVLRVNHVEVAKFDTLNWNAERIAEAKILTFSFL